MVANTEAAISMDIIIMQLDNLIAATRLEEIRQERIKLKQDIQDIILGGKK